MPRPTLQTQTALEALRHGSRLKQTGARWKVRRVERMAVRCAIPASDPWATS